MKTTIVVLSLLLATAAFGQAVSLVAPNASNFQVTDHPTRAISASMPIEQNLLGSNTLTTGTGEMPLWEAPVMSQEISLGDVARSLKKEHATAKKAKLALEK